jgi:hypothetical protein
MSGAAVARGGWLLCGGREVAERARRVREAARTSHLQCLLLPTTAPSNPKPNTASNQRTINTLRGVISGLYPASTLPGAAPVAVSLQNSSVDYMKPSDRDCDAVDAAMKEQAVLAVEKGGLRLALWRCVCSCCMRK